MNDTFYPTPPELTDTIADRISEGAQFILDPSAGSGALLDAVRRRFGLDHDHSGFYYERHRELYAVEQDPELLATLRGKGYTVVAFDFLVYRPAYFYDCIVMNPPFASGELHLLHALEIIGSGEIVCLLNRETLDNPFTRTRKLLAAKLAALGAEITLLGTPFQCADRPTDVDVVMIYARTPTRAEDGFVYWSQPTREAGNGTTAVTVVSSPEPTRSKRSYRATRRFSVRCSKVSGVSSAPYTSPVVSCGTTPGSTPSKSR